MNWTRDSSNTSRTGSPLARSLVVACALLGCSNSKDGSPTSEPGTKPASGDSTLASSNTREQELVVGVLYWSMQIPGQVAMREGLETSLPAINRKRRKDGLRPLSLRPFVAGDGDQGIEKQVGQMQALVDQGVDMIVVQPTDTAALGKVLVAANEKGIPVVAYDQHILNGKLAAFITSDNYQAGYLDGEYAASKFPDEQELKVVLVDYPQVSSTVERVDGFTDALESSGQRFRVLANYSAVEPVAGKAVGKRILRDFPAPGSIDVVFTVNDGGGLAVFEELRQAGRTEIFGATVDGDPNSVERIRRGDLIKIDSAQFCGELGATALRTADLVLRGEDVPSHQFVPVFPITRETVDRYPGWVGRVPDAFEKPWKSHTPLWSPEIRQPARREAE